MNGTDTQGQPTQLAQELHTHHSSPPLLDNISMQQQRLQPQRKSLTHSAPHSTGSTAACSKIPTLSRARHRRMSSAHTLSGCGLLYYNIHTPSWLLI